MMSQLIDVKGLHNLLGDPKLVIADCRFSLQDKAYGRQSYEKGHLPGAMFFDLDDDLSARARAHGGRHPLPKLEDFVTKLEKAGIANDSFIVVYDDDVGVFAGRLWWMMRYLGHQEVRLLDGGLQAWKEAGYALSQEVTQRSASKYEVNLQAQLLCSFNEVKSAIDQKDIAIIDARAAERYRGEIETIDKRAGHIPSAINKPFQDNLVNRRFKDVEALKQHYQDLKGVKEIIAYCGSGVSAAHNIIALNEAGFDKVKLYVGSWSDWSSYEENPIATGH
ncbi:MAG: sulfurtransferase [Deinococcales bacterium]